MSEAELPPELRSLFEAERAAPRVDANARVALRARLATSVAHWDRLGTSDLDTKQLEEPFAPLVQDALIVELRLAEGRPNELAHATAQEPVAAPPASGRVKAKMNILDKRIIGVATLTAVAVGLFSVTAYMRRDDAPVPQRQEFSYGLGPMVDLGRSFTMMPHVSPVAPTTGADLAITAGESTWIHVPIGAVDVEIQSKCNAEVEMTVATAVRMRPGAHPDDPPRLSTESKGGFVVVGSDSADGRATTYHLTPGLDPGDGMYEYTSRCVGQPPIRGNLVIDRANVSEPIGVLTNARVYKDMMTERSIHVFGTVLPGARVSIGAKPLALEPADPTVDFPPIYSAFATDVPISLDHLVAAVRVDDSKGTHFYVIRASEQVLVQACATTMTAPKQTAGKLDAQGDHAGALKALETAMAACKPDRDTLSLALSYACQAGNAEAARNYWRKLPPELQRTLEPVCARNQITREALDR